MKDDKTWAKTIGWNGGERHLLKLCSQDKLFSNKKKTDMELLFTVKDFILANAIFHKLPTFRLFRVFVFANSIQTRLDLSFNKYFSKILNLGGCGLVNECQNKNLTTKRYFTVIIFSKSEKQHFFKRTLSMKKSSKKDIQKQQCQKELELRRSSNHSSFFFFVFLNQSNKTWQFFSHFSVPYLQHQIIISEATYVSLSAL